VISDIEEKRQAMQLAGGGQEFQLRVRRMEEDIALLRTELNDTVKDVDDRLLRIEILLREVE
jgi:phage protein U